MKKVMFVVLIVMLLLAMALPAFAGPAEKVAVCHLTSSETNEWVLININDNAWDSHAAHGDERVGDTVDENCEPLTTVICPVNAAAEAAPGVNWSGCDLTGVDLGEYDLSGANLAGADLSGAFLLYTDLTNANLSNANLSGATLVLAFLTDANLTNANLTNADLYAANLTGANLTGADLSGAYLFLAGWSNTTCPDGTNSDVSGACTP